MGIQNQNLSELQWLTFAYQATSRIFVLCVQSCSIPTSSDWLSFSTVRCPLKNWMTILGGSPQLVNVGKWVYPEHPPVVSERILLTILTHNDSAGLAHTNKTYFKLSDCYFYISHVGSFWYLIYSYPPYISSIWVNYNISLTWIKAIWGWFPLLTMIPVRSQWGRYNLPRSMCYVSHSALAVLTSTTGSGKAGL